MKRLNLFLCFLCLTVAFVTQGQTNETETLNEDLKVQKLTDSVWHHTSYHEVEGFGRVPANGILMVSGNSAALIDTPWTDEQTLALFRWAEERLAAQIEVVVATHSHQDCAGGLAAAHRLGARSYASRRTARIAHRAGQPVPQTTFKRTLRVPVGSRQLKLHAAGPGHTADNIVVWIPEEKLLFGGCLVRSARAKGLGSTGEADLKRWPRTIRALLDAYSDARWIVPGHGSPGGVELLQHTLELLERQN